MIVRTGSVILTTGRQAILNVSFRCTSWLPSNYVHAILEIVLGELCSCSLWVAFMIIGPMAS